MSATMSRRAVLQLAGGCLATAAGVSVPRPAEAAIPEEFGPASLSAAIVGFTASGHMAYLVTRGQTPPKLIAYDMVAREVRAVVPLPSTGEGAWATGMSGGNVYVATYNDAKLIRYDPASGAVATIGSVGSVNDVPFAMATAPDGVVYVGLFNDARVWSYHPATAALQDLGTASTETEYARFIAVDDDYVYVGTTLPVASIVRRPRSAGNWTRVWPASGPSRPGGLSGLVMGGGRLYAAYGDAVIGMLPDGTDLVEYPAPTGMDALRYEADTGDLYAIGGRSGRILKLTGSAMADIGLAPTQDGNPGFTRLPSGRLAGASASGLVWDLDPAAGDLWTADVGDLEPAALGAEAVQSICASGSQVVWIGGHMSATVRNVSTGYRRRHRVGGEVKAMAIWGDWVLCALYPSTEIRGISRVTDGLQQSFGFLQHGQQRPMDMAVHAASGHVLIASAPSSTSLQGALTKLDPADPLAMEVRTDILVNQGVMSVDIVGDFAYVSGDIQGGGSATPVASAAQVAVVHVPTMSVTRRITPYADGVTLVSVAVAGGILYGLYRRPGARWFAYDLAQNTIVASGTLPLHGELVQQNGYVFAAVFDVSSGSGGDTIYRLGPNLATAKLRYANLGSSWYTQPQLEFRGSSLSAWTCKDGNLARVDLSV